ncbi:Orf y [Tanacetum coccineum]
MANALPNAFVFDAIRDAPQTNNSSQIRQLILLEDPYRGSTDEQDRAYRDLDRITCEDTKNLWSFLEDFRQLATKSGRLYFPSTTEKLFAKLPPSLSKKIEESFRAKHPGLTLQKFYLNQVYHYLRLEMCKDAALAKEIKGLSLWLCHTNSWLLQNIQEESYANEGNQETYNGKPLPILICPCLKETVFMAIEEFESDDDLEEEDDQFGHHAFMFHPGPPTKIAEMVQSVDREYTNKRITVKSRRLNYLDKTVNVKRKQPQKQEEEKNFNSNSNEVNLLKELLKEKTEQVQQCIQRSSQRDYEKQDALQKKKKIWRIVERKSLKQQDVTIEDKPLKHVTPAMEDLFRKHVDSLLKIGAIRPSKSRHRTMAMIDSIQVCYGRRSILGIAFLSQGDSMKARFCLWFENAPAVFQRKMDKCFRGTESFIAVYIDDILVFSKNEKDHAKHLEKMLKICEDNGLVLLHIKMKISSSTVDFLVAVIGDGTEQSSSATTYHKGDC